MLSLILHQWFFIHLNLVAMIKIRDIVQQLNLESYIELNEKFRANKNSSLSDCLILYREKLYTEEKMASLLLLDNSAFFDLKQNLRREIYSLLKIKQEEHKSSLVFKMLYFSSRPSESFSSEENFMLINLLQELIANRLEYLAAPLFEKLAQLNRNSDTYEEYYNLFRTHFNMMQSSYRSLNLFMHLNSKIGEFTESPCIEFINQIDKTFLEIKNIHKFNENGLTTCLANTSLILISLFCKDSKYAFTRNTSLLATFKQMSEQIENLPESIERFYLENILYFCSIKLKQGYIRNEAIDHILMKVTSQKISSLYYNFNFPSSIAKELITTNLLENIGGKVIDIKKHRTYPTNVLVIPKQTNTNTQYRNTASS